MQRNSILILSGEIITKLKSWFLSGKEKKKKCCQKIGILINMISSFWSMEKKNWSLAHCSLCSSERNGIWRLISYVSLILLATQLSFALVIRKHQKRSSRTRATPAKIIPPEGWTKRVVGTSLTTPISPFDPHRLGAALGDIADKGAPW